jgi:iron complex transport system substrate-binding protein
MVVAVSLSCAKVEPPQAVETRACIERFDPSIDYFPEKARVEEARLFSVSYHRHYKVFRARFPRFETHANDPGGDSTFRGEETFVLLQCGAPAPPLEGDLAGAFVISVPAQGVALATNEDLGMVMALGLLDAVVAVGNDAIYDDEAAARLASGRIKLTGGWGGAHANGEQLVGVEPDVVIFGAFHARSRDNLALARKLGLKAAPSMNRAGEVGR